MNDPHVAVAARHAIVAEDVGAILSAPLPWGELAGKTVLVTGAAGFLPSYLVETLLRIGQGNSSNAVHVVALARHGERATRRFAAHVDRANFRLLVQDVCDPLPDDLRADVVFHAASQASPKYYGVDPVGTMRANVVGTDQLLQLAVRSKSRRFLFVSSSEVYGNVPPERNPISESEFGSVNPVAVRSCYAEGKRAGESLCVSYGHQHGVPAVIVRPFHTYGPGLAADDGRVFADFVADIVAGRDIVMTSDGSARRAFCYVRDAIAGFFTALFEGQSGEAYNVGNDEAEISVRELAELLVGLFPEKRLKAVFQPKPQQTGYIASAVARNCPNTARIRALGWQPTVSIADGFRRTIQSYA